MVKLDYVPVGLTEINDYYGNPDVNHDGRPDPDWWDDQMLLYDLPWPMRTSWDSQVVTRQWIHKLVGDAMIDALLQIGQEVPYGYLRKCNCDRLGGIFNLRPKRGGRGELSTHSWGIAIDINPHLGPLGGPDNQPGFIKDAFVQRNFLVLIHDTMHFQACRGY